MKITTTGKKIIVLSEYHPGFIAKARELNGKYDRAQATWTFDARDEATVRAACLAVYGRDGLTEPECVDVQVTLRNKSDSSVFMYGRQLCTRMSRDTRVKLGHNVVIVSGAFPSSAGSTKYPELMRNGDTVVLEIRDVPASLVKEGDGSTFVRFSAPAAPAAPTAPAAPAAPTAPAAPAAHTYEANINGKRPFAGLSDEELDKVLALMREEKAHREHVAYNASLETLLTLVTGNMEGPLGNILTWDYENMKDMAPWDYEAGIKGGMGIDDARICVRTYDWKTPVADDPEGFKKVFATWQELVVDEVDNGTIAVCRGRIAVRNEGKWDPVTLIEIEAGPMSYDQAHAKMPEFSVIDWFERPWMHIGIDDKWYILRHATKITAPFGGADGNEHAAIAAEMAGVLGDENDENDE